MYQGRYVSSGTTLGFAFSAAVAIALAACADDTSLNPEAASGSIATGDAGPDASAPMDAPPFADDDAAPTEAPPSPDDAAPAEAPHLSALSLDTGSLSPAFSPTVGDYYASSLNSLFPVSVLASTDTGNALVTVNGRPATSGIPFSIVVAPREDTVVRVSDSSGLTRVYTVHYVPPGLPGFTIASSAKRSPA
jgi:hypothetical protein